MTAGEPLRCPACGTANPAGMRFCGECATPLARVCAVCRTVNPAGMRFCGGCAAPLPALPGTGATTGEPPAPDGAGGFAAGSLPPLPAARTPVPAQGARVAERRVCSVLFADLVGFTPLSERRDPEEVRELLSRYFDTARTVIGRYGGTVEKFIGDAVMAVWGTPVATESDAERAVRAALDVVDAVAALGDELGVARLAARAGVVTGEVAVRLGATGEGMVAGDAVNTAARVQAAAEPGTVLVDAATRRLSAAAIGFDDAGEHTLKGKAEPERLWRAGRVLSMVGGTARVDGLEAPLTGRDPELRTIKELFHAAAERRTPRLVVVSGAAGVGKSRLGWEFYKYVDGLATTVWWHHGRCLSYGEGVAFWALAEAIRGRLGIAEDDPAEEATAKLAGGLAAIMVDPDERRYVGVRVGRLLGLPVDGDPGGPMAREELFAGWRMFFERLAATAPVVLVVEDAQHGDSGLLDFCDHLVDWARALPIFLLVFARPELEQLRPGFGVGRNRSMLTLDPLDDASMRGLLDALVPGMPSAAVTAITRHAQGVPLFAVETVRSLVDRDVVQPIDGVYRLVGDLGELVVPDSLHGLLAGRLDALAPAVRSLVADAAVVGSSFPPEALVAVSGRPEAEVRAGLAELLRREVLEVSADPLSPQRGNYRFAQEMLRQVAYDTLSRRDRKDRHLAAAGHLRATFAGDGEEVADVIARHYLDALAAVPEDPDAAAIREEAVTASVRAAERAERAGAPARGAASYTTAAELLEAAGADGERAAALWEAAARAELTTSDFPAAVECAQRARRLFAGVGRPRDAARVRGTAGHALRRMGRHAEARAELSAALAVLGDEPDADTVAVLERLAALEVFAGTPDADRLSAEALELAQALDVPAGQLAGLFVTRGLADAFADRPAQSAANLREAVRLAERSGAGSVWAMSLLNLADLLSTVDLPAAADAARTAAEVSRRHGDRLSLGFASVNLADVLMTTGSWDEAEGLVREAIERDGLDDQDYVQVYRGLLAALRGDVGTAEQILAGLPLLHRSEDPQDRATLALTAAFTAESRGDPAEALRQGWAVLEHVDLLGVRTAVIRNGWPLAVRAARAIGDRAALERLLALLDGHPVGHLAPQQRAGRVLLRALLTGAADPAAAGPLFDTAIGILREIPAPYELGHALLDHAEFLVETGESAAAASALDEAGAIAERLGAVLLARRVRAFRPVAAASH